MRSRETPCSSSSIAFPQNLRTLDGSHIRSNARERTPKVPPSITAHVAEQRAQFAKHVSIVRAMWKAVDSAATRGSKFPASSGRSEKQVAAGQTEKHVWRPCRQSRGQIVHVAHGAEESVHHPIGESDALWRRQFR